jgi:diguanylate cyclase (GGDEF)-like protein
MSRFWSFLLGDGLVRRVWPLTLLLAISGAALATFAMPATRLDIGLSLPWWAFALIVAAFEAPQIFLHIKSEAHSFSLGELALAIGLFLVPPDQFLIGAIIGVTLAKLRLPPVKLAFNVAMWVFQVAAILPLFYSIVDPSDPFGPHGVIAAIVSMLVLGVIGVVAVSGAISLASGRIRTRPLVTSAAIAIPVNVANTGLGLIASYLVVAAPQLAIALIGPVLVFFAAYRAFVVEHQRHGRLKVVYQTTRAVLEAPEVAAAIDAVLVQTREVFRAEIAQIVLFPDRAGDPIPVSTLAGDGSVRTTHTQTLVGTVFSEVAATRRADRIDSAQLAIRGGIIDVDATTIRDVIIAPLEGERRLVGAIVIANRLGDTGGFDASDLVLLETLAGHAGVAIGNGRLERALDELRDLQAELAKRATTDPLTGLANRGHFATCLTEALANRSGPSQVGLIYVDLDDFKGVNDRHGHAAGDHLLQELASRLRSCLREGDVPGRLGGDELAVLIRRVDGDEQLARLVDRIQSALERPVAWAGGILDPKVSMGVTLAAEESTADTLLADGDTAMYYAKRAGKGQSAMYDPSMRSAQVSREALTQAIAAAPGAGELVLNYQPIIRLVDDRLVGVEALVRWNRPGVGLVPPSEFIPAAEQAGIIGAIGQWVIREACSQVARWALGGLVDPDLGVSVNISTGQLDDSDFASRVLEALHASGLEPSALTLEVTEHALADRSGDARGHLITLRERGIRVALDNFGTGVSSLGRLAEQPVDLLKLPSAFLDVGDGGRSGFIEALVAMGRSLGIPAIVDGVENAQDAERIGALGADFGQGFHFGKVMSSAEFEAWILTSGQRSYLRTVR